jgi:hypothetical protein
MMAHGSAPKSLDGWKDILQCIEALSGLTYCVRTMMRWASRAEDPLPVYRSPGGRDVHTSRKAVKRWWWRNRRLLAPVRIKLH